MVKSDCLDCQQKENCKLYLFAFDPTNQKSLNEASVKYPHIAIVNGQEECKGLNS